MPQSPTLAQAQETYIRDQRSRNLSENTVRVTQSAFAIFGTFLGKRTVALEDLTSDLFRDFHAWLRDTPKDKPHHGSTARRPGGIANRMRALRTFVKWLEDEELITHKVTVKEPAIPREFYAVLTDEELSVIFTSRWCNPDTEQGARNRAIFSLLLDTGLRVSEIGHLTLEDVLLDDHLLRIIGKGSKPRYVPFSGQSSADLVAWLKVRGKHPGSVFEIKTVSIQSLCREIGNDLGIVKISPHVWRHSFASRAITNGVDTLTLKRLMGHSSLVTTERYVSLSPKDLQEKHEQISPMNSFTQRQAQSRPRRRMK